MSLEHLLDLAELPHGDLPAAAKARARFSLCDWIVCGRAAVNEPLAIALRGFVNGEGGNPVASVFGDGRAPARAAALVNGATSHALDYDDTHFGHVGHLSVGVYPAALAAGEETDVSASDVVDAFLVGAEAATRVGMVLGRGHYNRGFHQTATAGAFGATVAAGRIYGLDRDRMRAAIGLCATRASGLKSQFGTMGKPYNAGIAASNGVECSALANAGFSSADDGLMGPQGFVATHSDDPDEAGAWADPPPGRFLFEDIKYKLHACCHGTHAMIEGLAAAKRDHNLTPERVGEIHLRTNPRWLSVCDIKTPRTGLEVKFSYLWLAGMVISGLSTASEGTYTDSLAEDESLARFAQRVKVEADPQLSDMQAAGEISLSDGGVVPFSHDLAARLPDAELEQRLRAKGTGLIGAAADGIWRVSEDLERASARDLGKLLRA